MLTKNLEEAFKEEEVYGYRFREAYHDRYT
jgi:hypothetical protein